MPFQPEPLSRARILVVEDDASVRSLIAHTLQRVGGRVEQVAGAAEALRALDDGVFDLILLDVNLPDASGLDVLSAWRARQLEAQLVVMSGDSADTAVRALKLGAFDYLIKPFEVEALLETLRDALEAARQRREALRPGAAEEGEGATPLVGGSPALQRVRELIARVAPTRAPVLVAGETGVGKRVVARRIHETSDRSGGAFVEVACPGLSAEELELQLFGDEGRAGSPGRPRGLLEEAHGGTLFLDGVEAIPPSAQARLLQVLQERAVRRRGGPSVPVDFRLVAASRVRLADEVAAGRLREDLYFRLSVYPITVPPLRERRGDIPLLVRHFRERFARASGAEPPRIEGEALLQMTEYHWPGNVRELESFVEHSLLLHAGSPSVPAVPCLGASPGGEHNLLDRALREHWSLERLEREHILAVLRAAGGHQVRAAGILGIDRRTLYRKLKHYRSQGEPLALEMLESA